MATRPLPASKLLAASEQIYTLLLGLYPAQFHKAYGRQMTLAFRDLSRAAWQQNGTAGLLRLWLSTLVDLSVTVLAERLAPYGGPGNVIQKGGMGLAAGITGGLVAGLGARLAMRGVSLANGLTPGFSREGTLAILIIGLIMGMPFGLVFMLLRSLLPGEGLWKGLTYGLLLFVIFIAPPFLFYREGEALLASPWLTVALFMPVALAYGLTVQFTALRLERSTLDKPSSAYPTSPLHLQLIWLVIFACLLELAVLGTTSILTHSPRIPMAIVRQLQGAHIPFAIARDLNAWLISLSALTYFGVATLMFWARNRSPMARFTAIGLLLFGGAVFNTGARYYAAITHEVGLIDGIFHFLQVAGATGLLMLLYIFPEGRFATGWSRGLAIMWGIWAVVWATVPAQWPEAVTFTILILFFFSGTIAQLQRYRQLTSPEQREQTRLVMLGFLWAVTCFTLVAIALLLLPDLRVAKVTGLSITATFSLYLLPWLFIPASIGWAMGRHGLWALRHEG